MCSQPLRRGCLVVEVDVALEGGWAVNDFREDLEVRMVMASPVRRHQETGRVHDVKHLNAGVAQTAMVRHLDGIKDEVRGRCVQFFQFSHRILGPSIAK